MFKKSENNTYHIFLELCTFHNICTKDLKIAINSLAKIKNTSSKSILRDIIKNKNSRLIKDLSYEESIHLLPIIDFS